MVFSYRELAGFFKDPLPPVEAVVKELINRAFEVEAVIPQGNDFELNIKIMPDRAFDAKTPLGMARELSAVLNQPLDEKWSETIAVGSARAAISFTVTDINNLVGVDFTEAELVEYLRRVRVKIEKTGKNLTAFIPPERLDLNIKEDLADEVARLYGYDRLPARKLFSANQPVVNHPDFTLMDSLREFFVSRGFTENYGYTFANQGEVAVIKPSAADQAFLRTELLTGLERTIRLNQPHCLFDSDSIKLFEIGTVFLTTDGEEKLLGFGISYKSAKFGDSRRAAEEILSDLKDFGARNEDAVFKEKTGIALVQIPLKKLSINKSSADLSPFIKTAGVYRPFSVFPRIIRDLALFVPTGTSAETVAEKIKIQAGDLLTVGPILFDEFPKEGKVSLAFRLVFQAVDRTLADREVNEIIAKISAGLLKEGWIVR